VSRHPRFPTDALTFLRALKRNNRREWFSAHKDRYEASIRQPMFEIIERLADDFRAFAPDLVASPKASMYRVYRDVRFSADKAPYKTHAAAHFSSRRLARHEGAGLYFHVSPEEIWIGGGMYAPQAAQLHSVREHIVAHYTRWKSIVESRSFRRVVGAIDGERLQRVPRGFAPDHRAVEYLRFRQFLAGVELPPAMATSARFYPTLIKIFRTVAPLVNFLNESLPSGSGAGGSFRDAGVTGLQQRERRGN
jgi:uncharacterized protein (TIGR02453 family)